MQFNDLMWGRSPTSHICPEAFVNALLNDSDDDVMAPPKKRSDGTSLGVASTCERPSSQGPSSQGSSLASSVDGGGGDGHTLDESVASVERSAISSSSPPNNKQRRPETPSEKDNSDNANVFVTHLPPQVEDTVLRGMFEPFGPVVSCVIMRDIFSGASRGVGFVLFQSPTAAQQAIAAMHRTTVLGKTITVQYGKMFAQGVPTTRMFVRNIPKTVSEEEMRALCAPFGDVTWISLHADSVKSSSSAKKTSAGAGARNIAFVNFATAAQAKAAADALHTTRPFAATHHHHSTPLAPSASGGDDHHGGSCCVCVDDDAPLLTKVVVEDLPNKTSRKERRSVGRTAHALQEDGGRRGERPQRQRASSGAGQRPEPATGVVQACITTSEAESNPKNQPSLVVADGNGARNASQKTTQMPATKASKKTTKGKQQVVHVPSTVDDASGHANRVCPQPMVVRLPLPPPPPPYTSSSISAW